MTENHITISLIVPIYNEAPFLPRCLDSIANQTVPFGEVILIDDASTDNSLDIATEYADKFNWRLIKNSQNVGNGETRNIGMKKAIGDWLTFLDSDDALFSSAHEAMLNAIETHQKADIIQFDHIRMAFGVKNAKPNAEGIYGIKNGLKGLPSFFYYVWNKIYRKTAVKDFKFSELRFGEDEAFIMELLCAGLEIQCVNADTVIKYFDNANSLCHIKRLKEFEEQDTWLNELLSKQTGKAQKRLLTELIDNHRHSTTYIKGGWKNE